MIKAVIFDMYETLITLFDNPLYFGTQMAADTGISEEKFQKIWRAEEKKRTIGKVTLEELLEKVLRENNCFSAEKMNYILKKRIHCKEEAFEHLHIEIIPMVKTLKENGILIGLISNCFSEEAMVIKKSVLYPFFDAVCLSFDEGIQKPDPAIFERCIEKLGVGADECLYVGDGGSNELEAAQTFGMQVLQAVWYLREGTSQPSQRKVGFKHMEKPMEVVGMINEN